jgi:hypothetical protein
MYDLTAYNKNHLQVCREILRKAKFSLFSPIPPGCYHMTAGRTARELWWTNREFCSVDIIPPWFWVMDNMPQFRDIVSSHRHDQNNASVVYWYIMSEHFELLS